MTLSHAPDGGKGRRTSEGPPAPDAPVADWASYYAAEHKMRVLPACRPAPGSTASAPACDSHPDCGRSAGKRPLVRDWPTAAAADPEEVQRLWAGSPSANVGVALGADFVALDIDGGGGGALLGELLGDLPPTWEVMTGNGRRLLFRVPGGAAPPATTAVRGDSGGELRLQSAGAQCVLPPSRHYSGKAYRWAEGRAPWEVGCAPVPPAVASFGGPPPAESDPLPERPRPERGPSDPDLIERRARPYLAMLPASVSGQGGHSALFLAARSLVTGFRLTEQEAIALLADDFNPRCEPPWSRRELEHKVREAIETEGEFSKPPGWLLDAPKPDARPFAPPARVAGFAGPPTPLAAVPSADPFPLGVFPPPVADYFRAEALALSVPPDYLAVPALAVMGACIGLSRAALVKPGYQELAILWAAIVAPPGSTKSAALARVLAPVQRAELDRGKRHREQLDAYAAEAARHAAALAKWQRGGCDGDPPAKPARPRRPQTRLDNFTKEAVVRVLDDSPRGVVVAKDELTGLVGQLNAYRGGKGDDKEFFLSGWGGGSYVGNRAGGHDESGPVVVPRVFLAVTGMIPPARLPTLFGESAGDGWADRFLVSYPDPVPAAGETWATVPPELARGYADLIGALLALEMGTDDRGEPATVEVPFGPGARAAWGRFTARMADRANALDPADPFRGVLSKLRGYCARLAGLLHHVWGGGDEIGAESVERAAALADYYESHGRRCRGATDSDPAARVARRLLGWLARHPERTAFTRSEAFGQLKDRRDVRSADALDPAFRLLAEHGYVARVPAAGSPAGPPAEQYAVNDRWRRTPEVVPKVPKDEPDSVRHPSNIGDFRDDFAGLPPYGPGGTGVARSFGDDAPGDATARPADAGTPAPESVNLDDYDPLTADTGDGYGPEFGHADLSRQLWVKSP